MVDAPATPSRDRAQHQRWTAEEWTLGALSLLGLVGFVVVFIAVLNFTVGGTPGASTDGSASPARTAALANAPQGRVEAGPRGERGPPGPPGQSGVRILRLACAGSNNCTVECDEDEVLLTAYCGAARAAANFPSERSASCRGRSQERMFVFAACVKSQPQ